MIIQTIAKFFKLAAIPLLLGFPIAIIAYRLQVWQMATSFQIIKFTGYGSAIIFACCIEVRSVLFSDGLWSGT